MLNTHFDQHFSLDIIIPTDEGQGKPLIQTSRLLDNGLSFQHNLSQRLLCPHNVIVVYKCRNVLKLVGYVEGIFLPPEGVKCLEGCCSPGYRLVVNFQHAEWVPQT